MVDTLRDQVGAQLETASTNDLISVGMIGAAFALSVALLVIRATVQATSGWSWWWCPLPALVFPIAPFAYPLIPKNRRKFETGPLAAEFLATVVGAGMTLESALLILLDALRRSWETNDGLLRTESRCLFWGYILLLGAGMVAVGLYAWGLS